MPSEHSEDRERRRAELREKSRARRERLLALGYEERTMGDVELELARRLR